MTEVPRNLVPTGIVAMASKLAEMRKQTELPSGVAPGSSELPRRGDRTDDLIAASLAGGMIAAGGKEITAQAAVEMFQAVKVALQIVSAG